MSIERPLVSVVIPVSNGERFVLEAIESVRRQGHQPLEIVVVDDGSTDGTAALIRERPDVRYIHQANLGPAAARNRGLEAARGEVIGFVDADDLWPPDKLAIQLPRLLADPDLGVVLGRVQYVTMTGGLPVPRVFQRLDDGLLFVQLGSGLYRRGVFDRVGLLDVTMRFAEDHDWFLRMREHGVPVVVVDAVTLLYRIHGTNMTRGQSIHTLGIMSALKKSLDRRRASGTLGRPLPLFRRDDVRPRRGAD
jgi:glycosyltransferase involved in cell wall biosynthesis